MPTGPQRAAIKRRITELRAADVPGPEDETVAYVGDLILEYATARLDERTVTAKAGAYLDTLSDVPAWAVREAIRRWRLGDVDADQQTLDFAPKPARLRGVALRIALVARGQMIRLQRVLEAEAEDEISEADRAENQFRIGKAMGAPGRPAITPAGTDAAERTKARLALAEREAAVRGEGSERSGERGNVG